MRPDSKIDYLELPAADLKAAEAFYHGVFGWHFIDYGPEYVAFTDGRMDGGFFKADLRSTTRTGGALLVIYADDIEAMRDKVLAAGGTLAQDIFDFPGGRRFHFLDPNGNELAVWTEASGE